MKRGFVYTFLMSAILLIGFSSCKKVKGDNEKIDTPNESVKSYMSTDTGSYWEFITNENEHFIRKPRGTTDTINDLVWDVYESTEQNTLYVTPEYFAKNQDKYLMLLDLDGSKENYLTTIVFVDSAKVGDSFTNTHDMKYGIINVNILLESEVTDVNASIDYQGETIDGVTVVKNKIKAKTAVTPYVDCGEAFLYFKRGIGVLKMDIDLSILTFYSRQYNDELIDYHIADEEE